MNGGTASTSELLAGALHAGGRAATMGEHTFGKGRTQKVLQLHDNATLLVSNSLVKTPALERIDKVRQLMPPSTKRLARVRLHGLCLCQGRLC